MSHLITTLGPKSEAELGMILPHEHIFVDLGPIEEANYRRARPEEVIPVMAPEIEKIKALGVTALVECTPEGVGRRADIDLAVSEATNFPVVVPTGIYREPWVPPWAQAATEDELYEWMLQELTEQIGDTGVQAAWIKISAGDDGITPCEAKILRAAARAGAATGAVIGSHTIRGRVVWEQLDILEEAGYTPERFIWIHTQAEPDFSRHLAVARRGAWIEYDAIGSERYSDEYFIHHIRQVLEAGLGDHLLLSHDRGWYDPSKPGGGTPKPYTYLSQVLLPKLEAAGLDSATLRQLTHTNPFRAFAR
ncbi:esterase [Litorilinea aerophila]|uniref:Esterase n=1 Tax=Litorilinea aerophila TaxID=1204385 RepID=A0A540VC34_9CHLR|nr:esterase [Litorilinea aerophila]MCC9077900.1 esterase [Litorilinea aerophila]OUC04918.1 esterase [Litorilinea aerophila]